MTPSNTPQEAFAQLVETLKKFGVNQVEAQTVLGSAMYRDPTEPGGNWRLNMKLLGLVSVEAADYWVVMLEKRLSKIQ